MGDWKGLLLSKTVWSVVLMVLARFVPELAGVEADEVVKVIADLITAIGAVGALVGRVVAKDKILGFVGRSVK